MFRRLLKNSSTLLTQQQTSILSAAFIIMAMTFVSKLLGVLKLRLLVHYFGASDVTAAFLAADKLPELFYDVLVSAILSVSFIPIFSSYMAKDEADKASKLASIALNLTLLVYAIVAIIAFIWAKPLAHILAPGFETKYPETFILMARLLRLMLLAQFFLIAAGYVTAVLQSHQRFIAPAIAMTLYNVAIILGIVLLGPFIGIYATVVGMIIGAALQLLFQLPFLSFVHFHYSLNFSPKFPGIQQIAKLSIPRMVGLMSSKMAEQFNIALASLLSAVSIISLDYATRLSTVPVSLFAVAIAQAALPALSLAYAKKEYDQFQRLFLSCFNQILFFVIPIAAAFIILRLPIVRLIFGDPNFSWQATVTTGRTLALLGFGSVAQSLIMLLARTFYAMHDSKTPLKIALATVLLNVVLSYVAVKVFGLPVWWLALIFSFTTILNAVSLLVALHKKIGGFAIESIVTTPAKLLFCGFAMVIVMYIPLRLMDLYVWQNVRRIGPIVLPPSLQVFILDTRYTVNVIILVAIAGLLGIAAYLGLAIIFGIEEVNMVNKAVKKVSGVRKLLSQSPEVIETSHPTLR